MRQRPERLKKRAAKLLVAVLKVAFENIPADPAGDVFRHGDTLGDDYKHWFRAKFLQQYRLFFRYQQTGAIKIIVLANAFGRLSLRSVG